MKKLTKTIFAMFVLAAPLFFMACEEETTLVSTEYSMESSNQEEEADLDID